MGHLLSTFNTAKIFTKIDLWGAYYLIWIAERPEELTTFNTRHGSFEYLVMPFGLTNAPATSQSLMNELLGDLVKLSPVFYLHDILIYSQNKL